VDIEFVVPMVEVLFSIYDAKAKSEVERKIVFVPMIALLLS